MLGVLEQGAVFGGIQNNFELCFTSSPSLLPFSLPSFSFSGFPFYLLVY
jgi:hypothetical protein